MIGRAHLLYLHAQQDRAFCQDLEKHLSSLRQEGVLRDWGEGSLLGGDEIEAKLQAEIARADIVVLLLSADFVAAERRQAQIDLVLAERDRRPVIIIPVLVRAVDWRRGRLGRFYSLPRNGKPVASWDRADDAWFDVAEGLRQLIQKDAAAPGCPFPGLEFFDEVQAPLFVGREKEIREALSGLGQTADGYRRWLQIEGASGAGKSSFARAGLLPAVRRGEPKGAPSDWLIGVLRPGREPLANLARALVDALPPVKALEVAAVTAQLRAGGDALKDLLLAHAPPRRGLLLVIDQMEELFTLSEEQSAEVKHLDGLLNRALAGDGALHLLTTVRTDFLGHMSRLPELEATMNRASRYYLRPIKQERLRETLAELAHRTDVIWEGGLLDRLVADAGDEEGVLPLVGHVLRALWAQRVGDTLTNAAYETIQGVAGALSASADGLLASLDAKQRIRAQALLLSLVKIGRGAADTRRVVLRPEALQAAGGGPEADLLLARLSGGRNPEAPAAAASPPRLVVVSGPAEQPAAQRVDLAHEAVLRRWTTLRAWVDADRKMLERRDDLEAAALGWKEAGCPQEGLPGGAVLAHYQGTGLPKEQRQRLSTLTSESARNYLRQMEESERRRRRSRRQAAGALGVLTAAAVVLGGLAGVQWRRADGQRQAAETSLSEANGVADKIVFLIEGRLQNVGGAIEIRRELLKEAAALQDKLRARSPGSLQILRGRMVAHSRQGDLFAKHDDQASAGKEYEAALHIAEELVRREPGDGDYQHDLSVSYNQLGDLWKAQGDLAKAESWFKKSLEQTEKLAKADPSNAALQRDLSLSYNQLGDLWKAQGDLAKAESWFKKSLEQTEKLAKADPSNALLQGDLSLSYNQLGDLRKAQGDLAKAESWFKKSLELRENLAKADPSNASLQRDLSLSYQRLGDLSQAQGDLAKAESWFKKSLKLTEKLAKADPSNASLQRDLSFSYNQLGDLSQAQGDLAKAESWFEKSLEQTEKLAKADPSNAELQRDLSLSYQRLGDLWKAQGDLAKAESWVKKALELTEKLAKADPSNAELQCNLSLSYQRLGDLSQAQGDLAKAESWVKKALELTEKLAKADPSNASLQRNLSVSYNQLGDLSQAQGDLAKAESWVKKALELTEKLTKADPSNASLQRDLSVSYQRLGDLWKAQGDLAKAESWFNKYLELTEKLAKADPSNAELQRDLLFSHLMFIQLGDAQRAPNLQRPHVRAAEEILGRFQRESLFVGDPQLAQIRALVDRVKRTLR